MLERLHRALWGGEMQRCCDHSSPALRLCVRCAKCGELVCVRIEKAYELEAEYESTNGSSADENEEPKPTGYSLRKEMVGAQCQNLMYVTMHLDAHRDITHREVEGGELVEAVDCE